MVKGGGRDDCTEPRPPGSDVGDGDLHLHARLDGDRSDLLHDVRRRVQVDEALVDAHLPTVKRVRALAVGALANAQPEGARRQADGPRDMQLLVPRTADEVRADLLE